MARKKESGIEIVAALPWPVGIVLGVLGFWAVRYGAGWYFSHNGGPLLAGLGQQLSAGSLTPLAWLVLLVFWTGAGMSFLQRRRRSRLLATRTDLASIASLSWREFEQLVGQAFRQQGFLVAETGQGGADGGVDLVLRRDGRVSLVQCKRWRQKQVPVSTVREMWGLLAHHGADSVRIACVGDYTPDACRFAEGKAIELITGAELVALVRQVQQTGPRADDARRVDPTQAPTQDLPPANFELPVCPKCAGPMARRTNRRDGAAFWGCKEFPRCRGTRTA